MDILLKFTTGMAWVLGSISGLRVIGTLIIILCANETEEERSRTVTILADGTKGCILPLAWLLARYYL